MLDLQSFKRDPFRIVIALAFVVAIVVYVGMAAFTYHNLATHQLPRHAGEPRPQYIAWFPPGAAFFLAIIWAVLACFVVLLLGMCIGALIRFFHGDRGI